MNAITNVIAVVNDPRIVIVTILGRCSLPGSLLGSSAMNSVALISSLTGQVPHYHQKRCDGVSSFKDWHLIGDMLLSFASAPRPSIANLMDNIQSAYVQIGTKGYQAKTTPDKL